MRHGIGFQSLGIPWKVYPQPSTVSETEQEKDTSLAAVKAQYGVLECLHGEASEWRVRAPLSEKGTNLEDGVVIEMRNWFYAAGIIKLFIYSV